MILIWVIVKHLQHIGYDIRNKVLPELVKIYNRGKNVFRYYVYLLLYKNFLFYKGKGKKLIFYL